MSWLTCTNQAHRPQDDDCLRRLNDFARTHRLREMKWSGRNLKRIIRRAAGPEAPRGFLSRRTDYQLESDLHGPFDHPEIWGRDRVPLVIVGHPYDFSGDRVHRLRWLEHVGLDLLISPDAGWYGYGTYHVRASVPGALPPLSDVDRFVTEMVLSSYER